LTKIEGMITKPGSFQPNANYFGHEIPDVSEILSNVVKAASDFTSEPVDFFPVVKKTVGLAHKMICTQEPWQYLQLVIIE
jgi:hypothetical protein